MIVSVPGRCQSSVSTENSTPIMPSALPCCAVVSFHDQYGGR